MKIKTIVLLFAIFIFFVLIAGYPFIKDQLPWNKTLPPNKELPFQDFTQNTVSSVVIQKGKESVELTKDAEDWKVASFSAYKTTVDSFFSAFKNTSVGSIVSKNPHFESDYEVTTISGTLLSISTTQGKRTVIIGKAGPNSGSFYVRPEGSKNVYLASGPLSEAYSPTVSFWRDKTIINVTPSSLVEIEINDNNVISTLTKNDKGIWEISSQGKKAQLLDSDMSSFLSTISPLEGSEFLTDSQQLEYDKGKQVSLVFRGKDKQTIGTLHIYNDGAYYWLKNTDKQYVLTVPGYKLDNFFKLTDKVK